MRKEISLWIKVLESQVGVEEVRTGGGNHGPRIDAYLRAVHLDNPKPPRPGYAWCNGLMGWSADEAERLYNVLIPLVRTADCDVSLSAARKTDTLFSTPQVGDQFLVMASKYNATHTGAVIAVAADGRSFSSIEGNTNTSGEREGWLVAKNPLGKPRPVSSRYLFYRWPLLLAPEVAAPPLTYALVLNGRKLADMPLLGGAAYAPARILGEACGVTVGWDAELQAVLYNGVPVPEQVTWINNTAWVPVRVLALALGLSLVLSVQQRVVSLAKGAA